MRRRVAGPAKLSVVGSFAGLLAAGWAGLAEADFELGLMAYHQGDYETAFEEVRPDAEAGDPRAQTRQRSLLDESLSRDEKARAGHLREALRSAAKANAAAQKATTP